MIASLNLFPVLYYPFTLNSSLLGLRLNCQLYIIFAPTKCYRFEHKINSIIPFLVCNDVFVGWAGLQRGFVFSKQTCSDPQTIALPFGICQVICCFFNGIFVAVANSSNNLQANREAYFDFRTG